MPVLQDPDFFSEGLRPLSLHYALEGDRFLEHILVHIPIVGCDPEAARAEIGVHRPDVWVRVDFDFLLADRLHLVGKLRETENDVPTYQRL